MTEEDYKYGIRKQAQIDADEWSRSVPIHQKVGTVIPFSRTVDRDPNPRIPLSVPGDYISIGKREALLWFVLMLVWLGYLFFGPGER